MREKYKAFNEEKEEQCLRRQMKPVRIRSVLWDMKLVEAIGEKLDFISFSFLFFARKEE